MQKMKTAAVVLFAMALALPVMAAKDNPEERGKALFNDPKAFGGSKACSECHPGGKGLESAGGKKEFHVAGKTQHSLEEAINACIENASMGKAIDTRSDKMKDTVAYIQSLKKKKNRNAPGY